jgi:anaphase-promoting complex subunit 4
LHRIDHADPFDEVARAALGKHAVTLRFELEDVVDLKFVDDEQIMFLLKSKGLSAAQSFRRSVTNAVADGSSNLLSLPYRSSPSGPNALFSYSDFTANISKTQLPNGRADSITKIRPTVLDKENIQPYVKHVFPTMESFKPAKIEVNGRKNRRVCVVLSEDGKQMRIYDLDFKAGAEDWVDVGGEGTGREYMMTALGFE